MNVVSYIDPARSFLPATGVGRHMNNMLLGLAQLPDVSLSTLFSREFADSEGRLSTRSPLRELPSHTIPLPIQLLERMWKLFKGPAMDRWVSGADWIYLPEECYFPARRARIAVTVHDCHAFEENLPWSNTRLHRSKRRRWGMWMRPMLQRADRVLAVSEFTRRRLLELFGVSEDRVVTVGNGVEDRFFEMSGSTIQMPEGLSDEPYVLVVGGLIARKGGDNVLGVADALHRRRSSRRIFVAGRSEPRLEAAAKLRQNIVLLGPVTDSVLPRLLRSAVGLLFLSEYEGFGIPALEAMACRTLAIVARRAALPETVGDAGIVVEPTAHDAVADLLEQISRAPRDFDLLREKGTLRAESHRWSACVDRLRNALN